MEIIECTCSLCKKPYKNYYSGEIAEIMKEQDLCFTCALWTMHYLEDMKGKRKYAIVNGNHYILEPHTSDDPKLRGSYGVLTKFRFLEDGHIETCDNVWHQGTIPEHFRSIMPDNAEFVIG